MDDVGKFVTYLKTIINLKEQSYAIPYKSLSVCLIDCVYSLRAKYFAITVPIVNRYAAKYMNGNKYNDGEDLNDLVNHIEEAGGPELFTKNVIRNMQVIGGVRKSEVIYKLANYLLCLGIKNIDDFRKFKYPELLELVIHAVKGMGDAGTSYLFMLAGSDDKCKPDVHIHHCVVDALGFDLDNNGCQELLTESVKLLKNEYNDMTVKRLDGLIWYYYQSL